MLKRRLAVALKNTSQSLIQQLILLSVTHRRILTTISSMQVLGNGAVRSDCPEDEEHA